LPRDNVLPQVGRTLISAANLGCAIAVTSQIRDRAISCVRELRRTITAIDISARKLIRTDRSAGIRTDVLRTELHRSRRTKRRRRETLARINHLSAAEASHRHGMK